MINRAIRLKSFFGVLSFLLLLQVLLGGCSTSNIGIRPGMDVSSIDRVYVVDAPRDRFGIGDKLRRKFREHGFDVVKCGQIKEYLDSVGETLSEEESACYKSALAVSKEMGIDLIVEYYYLSDKEREFITGKDFYLQCVDPVNEEVVLSGTVSGNSLNSVDSVLEGLFYYLKKRKPVARGRDDSQRQPPAVTSGAKTGTGAYEKVRISKIICPDTVQISTGEKVKMIGIYIPGKPGRMDSVTGTDGSDMYTRLYNEAAVYVDNSLKNKVVRLEFDKLMRDDSGNLLAYVYIPDEGMFNARMIQDGYSALKVDPPNVRYAALFTDMYRDAVRDGKGLWREKALN